MSVVETAQLPPFLRYPGGKRRMLSFLQHHIPARDEIQGRYIEPFVGGGAVFFFLRPYRGMLADLNSELIHLYEGIRNDWAAVWDAYSEMPSSKEAYREIRSWQPVTLSSSHKAARLLYLNRTCFKGMWRHNTKGQFNVGYGGQSRRWVITAEALQYVSSCLQHATLHLSDFEPIINSTTREDFIFLDPPYRPGAKEMIHDHYMAHRFSFADHQRLADCLRRAAARGVRWALTTSSHEEIVALFGGYEIIPVPRGTGEGIGQTISIPGEVLICNGG